MNDKPVEPAASNEELARKIETHLTLDEGSPGFLLNRADFERIVRALRPDRENVIAIFHDRERCQWRSECALMPELDAWAPTLFGLLDLIRVHAGGVVENAITAAQIMRMEASRG